MTIITIIGLVYLNIKNIIKLKFTHKIVIMNVSDNNLHNEDMFDEVSIPMDDYCISHDIDEYDLYGEKMLDTEEDACDIQWE